MSDENAIPLRGDKPPGDVKRPSAQSVLTGLAMYDAPRVHGDDGVAYAIVDGTATRVDGQDFRDAITRRFWRRQHAAPPPAALTAAIELARADTHGSHETVPVHNRIGGDRDVLYLALYDRAGTIVRATCEGWELLAPADPDDPRLPSVLFRRPQGAMPLPLPERGGSLDELRPFVNVAGDDWVLLVAWLLGTMMPRGPYPILALSGEAGSGKSWTARLLRSVMDPARGMDRGAPRDLDALLAAARACRVLVLDNLSFIGGDMSDVLCRIASGGTIGARQLYTNHEEVTATIQRPVIVNGIPDLVARGDLASRTIALSLPRLEDGFRGELAMEEEFKAAHPHILGALLDAAVLAMRDREQHAETGRRLRMAEFVQWVEAAAPALGVKPGVITRALQANGKEATRVVLDSDPLAERLIQIAAEGFDGMASELLDRLGGSPHHSDKGWPRTASHLSGKIQRLAGPLRDVGVECQRTKTKRGGHFHLSMQPGAAAAHVAATAAAPEF